MLRKPLSSLLEMGQPNRLPFIIGGFKLYSELEKCFMKRVLAFLAIYFVIFLSSAHATPEGDEIRLIDKARFGVLSVCAFTIYSTNPNVAPVKKYAQSFGNGLFIEHPNSPHLAVSAGHVVDCGAELPDFFFDNNFKKEDVSTYAVNSHAIYALLQGRRFSARILAKGNNGLGKADIAILKVILPEGTDHYHIPILENTKLYDLGSEVAVRGYMPSIRSHRFKKAVIENIFEDDELIQINTSGYSGMSGSPVLFWRDGKYYLIGIFVGKWQTEDEGVIDASVFSRLTPDLIKKAKEKPASK